jgi:Putative MetA-pathway of phenol degradation
MFAFSLGVCHFISISCLATESERRVQRILELQHFGLRVSVGGSVRPCYTGTVPTNFRYALPGRTARTVFLLLLLSVTVPLRAQEQNAPASQSSSSSAPPSAAEQGGAAPDQNTGPASAQTDLLVAVPNRPTFATTAETVQRGVFEIEYGLEAASGHQNINGLLKFGAVKNLELRFANNPIERDAAIAGTGDSGAGFKYKLFAQSKKLPTFSVLYTATIPTAPATRGAGAVGHSVQLLFSKDYGQHHFDFNEGTQFVGRPGASGFDRNYFTSLSYSYPLTKKWGVTGEAAGFSRTNATTPATMVALEALTYSPSPRLVFDFGGYFAVYGNLPRFTFAAGLTYAVADLYHLHRAREK